MPQDIQNTLVTTKMPQDIQNTVYVHQITHVQLEYTAVHKNVTTLRRYSSVDIVTRLQGGKPNNRGAFSDRDNRLFSSVKCPDRFWGPRSLLFNWY